MCCSKEHTVVQRTDLCIRKPKHQVLNIHKMRSFVHMDPQYWGRCVHCTTYCLYSSANLFSLYIVVSETNSHHQQFTTLEMLLSWLMKILLLLTPVPQVPRSLGNTAWLNALELARLEHLFLYWSLKELRIGTITW